MNKRIVISIIIMTVTLNFSADIQAAEIKFSSIQSKLPSLFIKEIKMTENYFWIATSSGLIRSDKEFEKQLLYNKGNGLPDDYITSIAVTNDEKEAWIGTAAGLAQINITSGKITIFNKKNSKISDNSINAVCLFHNEIYLGNSYGIDVLNISTNQWRTFTPIEGLAGGNVQAIESDGFNIWAGGSDGLSFYDRNEDFWDSYGVENGLNSPLITSISIDHDAVWSGTMGGGLLRFDRSSLRFEPFTTDEGLIDDNVQSVFDDGQFLWIGTFGGFSSLNKTTLVFQNYDNRAGLTEVSTTSGMVFGNYLLIGSDGGGIFKADKGLPQVEFLREESEEKKKGEISLYATLLSDKNLNQVELSYKMIALADQFDYNENAAQNENWVKADVGSKKISYKTRISTLKTSTLKDGKYLIMLKAVDSSGAENINYTQIIVDNVPPNAQLFFREPESGQKVAKVSGSYQELNLLSINVMIGDRKVIPSVNRQTRRFRFDYPLDNPGKISVSIDDTSGNEFKLSQDYLVDKDPPELTLDPVDTNKIDGNLALITGKVKDVNIDQVIILPDQVEAELSPVGDDTYTFKANAAIKKEGVYTYQVSATDKSGKTTIKSLDVNFFSKITIVETKRDKIPEFTLKDNFPLSGNILGPPLKDFYAISKESGIKYPIEIKKDKSFNSQIPLKEGENTFEVVKVYDDNREEKDLYTIKSSSGNVKASFNLIHNSFISPNITLTGTYDPGVSRVLIDGKEITLDKENHSFTLNYTLKKNKNIILLQWFDETGKLYKNPVTIFQDNEKPALFIRSLPEKTGLAQLPIKGKVADNVSYELTLYPASELTNLDMENGEFSGYIHLKKGENFIKFIAMDDAGNFSIKEYIVDYNSSYPKIEVSDRALNDELELLKMEISRLKQELGNKGKRGNGEGTSGSMALAARTLPAHPGLYRVPMAGKVKSYTLTAKIYLGSENFANLLAGLNGKVKPDQTHILVPTPEYFAMMVHSAGRKQYEQFINVISTSFNKSIRMDDINKTAIRYLLRTEQLKEIKEFEGFTALILQNNIAVIVAGNRKKISKSLKNNIDVKEVLVANISEDGFRFELL